MSSERRAFGERLRRQRERRQVALSQIAETTKVTASHFAALERGDCSRWPGGMYNRAFIRGYAKAIGLDPDETAAEFSEYYDPPPVIPPQKAEKAPQDAPVLPSLRLGIEADPDAGPKRAVRLAALIVVDLLAIVALAATGMLFTAASFWIALAAASIGYHVLSRVIRTVPRTAGLTFRTRRAGSLRRHETTPDGDDLPVSSTASTVA